jgi:hypothetical protein
MPDVVLATINARYSHASFGLRYLMANLGDCKRSPRLLRVRSAHRSPDTIADRILEEHPRIVGLGVYIWNVTPTTCNWCEPAARPESRSGHRAGRPGGQPRVGAAGDLRAGGLRHHRRGATWPGPPCAGNCWPANTRPSVSCPGGFVDVNRLLLPYQLYPNEDIAERVIYVEASRGCPFTCEFCLSSLNVPVRRFPAGDPAAGFRRICSTAGCVISSSWTAPSISASNTVCACWSFSCEHYRRDCSFTSR